MSATKSVVHAFLHVDQVLVVRGGGRRRRTMGVVGAGAVAAVIAHVARGAVQPLEHHALGQRVGVVVVLAGILERLPAARLVLVVRMVLLVLHAQALCLVHERALLLLIQKPGTQKNKQV